MLRLDELQVFTLLGKLPWGQRAAGQQQSLCVCPGHPGNAAWERPALGIVVGAVGG